MQPIKTAKATNDSKANETCRMSWFLIEISSSGGDKASDLQNKFCIIHAVDLIDEDLNLVYINRQVKFNHNQSVLEGKVILASDDRRYVETHLAYLQNGEEANPDLLDNESHFLLQYNKGAHNIIHAVVHEKDICWPVGDLTNQREVLIGDGKIQRLAKVLFAQDTEARVLAELAQLKQCCFDLTFDASDEVTKMSGEEWLLLQYNCSSSSVVYTIVNYKDTVLQNKNWHDDVVAYLSDGISIYQAIILRKSDNREILDEELSRIKNACTAAQFPLGTEQEFREEFENLKKQQSESPNCEEAVKLECTKPDDDDHLTHDLEMLEEIEEQMQKEAGMIADAFEAIDHTRRNMEKRLTLLNSI